MVSIVSRAVKSTIPGFDPELQPWAWKSHPCHLWIVSRLYRLDFSLALVKSQWTSQTKWRFTAREIIYKWWACQQPLYTAAVKHLDKPPTSQLRWCQFCLQEGARIFRADANRTFRSERLAAGNDVNVDGWGWGRRPWPPKQWLCKGEKVVM